MSNCMNYAVISKLLRLLINIYLRRQRAVETPRNCGCNRKMIPTSSLFIACRSKALIRASISNETDSFRNLFRLNKSFQLKDAATAEYSFNGRTSEVTSPPPPLARKTMGCNRGRDRESVNNSAQTCSSRTARYRAQTTREITRNIAGHLLVNTGNIYQTFLLSVSRERLGSRSRRCCCNSRRMKRTNKRKENRCTRGATFGRVVPKLLTAETAVL